MIGVRLHTSIPEANCPLENTLYNISVCVIGDDCSCDENLSIQIDEVSSKIC